MLAGKVLRDGDVGVVGVSVGGGGGERTEGKKGMLLVYEENGNLGSCGEGERDGG